LIIHTQTAAILDLGLEVLICFACVISDTHPYLSSKENHINIGSVFFELQPIKMNTVQLVALCIVCVMTLTVTVTAAPTDIREAEVTAQMEACAAEFGVTECTCACAEECQCDCSVPSDGDAMLGVAHCLAAHSRKKRANSNNRPCMESVPVTIYGSGTVYYELRPCGEGGPSGISLPGGGGPGQGAAQRHKDIRYNRYKRANNNSPCMTSVAVTIQSSGSIYYEAVPCQTGQPSGVALPGGGGSPGGTVNASARANASANKEQCMTVTIASNGTKTLKKHPCKRN